MQFYRLIGAAIALFAASSAGAENWVTVFDDNPIYKQVDRDSIHTGDDGLVYFRSDGPDIADRAADCRTRTLYTLKLYVMNGLEYPQWRDNGKPVVAQSAGESTLNYACTNR